jgi:predicted ATP-dependent protease
MPARKLKSSQVGLPKIKPPTAPEGDAFDLSSHARAREALEFAIDAEGPGFNVFVLGPDRSGRMTATVAFLERMMAERPAPCDWIYLNNFAEPHRPTPVCVPAGEGRRLQTRMTELLPQLRDALQRAFGAADYEKQLEAQNEEVQRRLAEEIEKLQAEAKSQGLDIQQSPQGFTIVPVGPDGAQITAEDIPEARRKDLEESAREISAKLRDLRRYAAQQQMRLAEQVGDMNRQVAENAVGGLMDEMEDAFAGYEELVAWLKEMRADILENLARFKPQAEAGAAPGSDSPERRYAVNLLVDNARCGCPPVVVEPAPSLETVFGYIEYRQAGGVLETDFSMIRPGALHRANGGVLVLRADALAAAPGLWDALKAALRDREIALGSPLRSGAIPIAGSPQPHPVPLQVKIALVASPQWYYTFFSVDPEFQTFFRVKADVDADMEASRADLKTYAGLIRRMARDYCDQRIDDGAVARLLGMATRWTGDRRRLTAQFERIEDALREAAHLTTTAKRITAKAVDAALASRRGRNARIEDRLHEQIAEGTVMIDVTGTVRGQVNALTVRSLGDHAFGTPSRVTARASIGRRGVINVERDVAMGGPIQQKGAMVVQGFLAGHFARRFPLSFNCSITFEQSYGGVEGDSASLAELVAILSELSGLPVRQDLAITGSVNQLGQSQAVGGVHHKIEGFYRTCRDRGELTGEQGVVIPRANEPNLVLGDEVAQAVARGRFHIWSVRSIDEAAELFLGVRAGRPNAAGDYSADSIYGRVATELARFDAILREAEQINEELAPCD